jgi:putative transposase
MKLVVQIQLLPDPEPARTLRATIEQFNAACNWVAGVAFERRLSNRISLQQIVYRDVRERFGLSAQTTCLCIRRVCDAYKRDKSICPEFRKHAAIPFDQRTMGFKGIDRVSLLTLDGRVVVPFILGSYQADRLKLPKGQSDLMLRKDGKWFLIVTVDVPEAAPIPVTDFIGVDLGVKNLATTDDGETFSGDDVEKCRQKYQKIRQTCQQKGTKSAKRKLRKVRSKESRFRANENHIISKKIVAKAKGTGKSIACEDLAGIGIRTTAPKPQRSRLKGWAFYQLRCFLTYKATLAGIPVIPVDPRNTSRECSACGYTAKNNRRSRDHFQCRQCGFTCDADVNAAKNIKIRAKVMWPNVGIVDAGPHTPTEITCKPQDSFVGS